MAQYYDQFEGPKSEQSQDMVQGRSEEGPRRSAHPPGRCHLGPGKGQARLCQGAGGERLANREKPIRTQVQRQQRGPHAPRPGCLVGEGLEEAARTISRQIILESPERLRRQEQPRLGPCRAGRPGQEAAGVGLCARPIIRATTRASPTPCRPWVGSTSGAVSSTRPRMALDQAIKATTATEQCRYGYLLWPIFCTIWTRMASEGNLGEHPEERPAVLDEAGGRDTLREGEGRHEAHGGHARSRYGPTRRTLSLRARARSLTSFGAAVETAAPRTFLGQEMKRSWYDDPSSYHDLYPEMGHKVSHPPGRSIVYLSALPQAI